MNSATDVWNKVLKILGNELTSTAISTWFDDCQAVEIGDNKLVLYTPSTLKKMLLKAALSGR